VRYNTILERFPQHELSGSVFHSLLPELMLVEYQPFFKKSNILLKNPHYSF